MLTGVFPKSKSESITTGPLSLVKCTGGTETCGLLQSGQSYDLHELYGMNYGYRSGLNKSMVDHLQCKVKKILSIVKLQKNDLIIDIGSNDSTFLQAYPAREYQLVGIDPTGIKFQEFYPSHIQLIPNFGPYQEFAAQISCVKEELLEFLHNAKRDGNTVMGLGASTKGNVILQYCGVTEKELPCIGDVNPDKFGCYTPGTMIPIVPENEVLEQNPDYLLVLPWHFKSFFLSCNHLRGRNLVFPLPKLDIVKV